MLKRRGPTRFGPYPPRAWGCSFCPGRARVGVGFGRIPCHPRARDRMGCLGGFRGVQAGTGWRFMAVPHHARRWLSLAFLGPTTGPRARLDPFDSFARRSRTCVFVRFRHTPRARGPLGFVGCLARVNRPICPTVARVGCRIRRGSFGFLLVPSTRGTCAALRFLAPPGGPECPAHRPALLQGEPSITFRGSTASRGPVAPAQGPRNAATLCVAWRARSPRALWRLDLDRWIVLLGSVPGFVGIRSGVCWDPFVIAASDLVS